MSNTADMHQDCVHSIKSGNSDSDDSYGDDFDVPPREKYGLKIWDYFYILKGDFIKGLNLVPAIYKKERNLLHKYVRASDGGNSLSPTFKVINNNHYQNH